MGQFFTETTALIEKLDSVRKNNKKIVFTNGCFDLLHIGHVKYLKEAKSKGDFLVVGINSDASVKRLKGPTRPIQTETDRSEILAALEAVDATVIFTENTPEMLIKMLRPDVLVKGGDWKIDQIVGGDFVQSNGGQVLSLMFIDGKSTTNIVSKIEQK
jgi:D-glycero-beta-D-manno-heptose 1-phosphate adenylyltransferase